MRVIKYVCRLFNTNNMVSVCHMVCFIKTCFIGEKSHAILSYCIFNHMNMCILKPTNNLKIKANDQRSWQLKTFQKTINLNLTRKNINHTFIKFGKNAPEVKLTNWHVHLRLNFQSDARWILHIYKVHMRRHAAD